MTSPNRSQTVFRRPMMVLALILVFVIYLSKLVYDIQNKNTPPSGLDNASSISLPLATTSGETCSSPAFQAYFTAPGTAMASQQKGGPDVFLAAAIDNAQQSVDMAIYNLSLDNISNALLHAKERGVQVRLVMESDSLDKEKPQRLKDAGIPILGDRSEALMHHKFTIIDAQEVWTGSMNYTSSGAYNDNNNLIRICSNEIAKNYTHEFEKMFTNDLFGDDKTSDTPFPESTVDGKRLEVYFSPQDGISQHLAGLVSKASQSIDILAYTFTLEPLAESIKAQAAAGVKIRGVFEKEQLESEGNDYPLFLQAGYDVHLDGNPGLMHHKVIIIDGKIVVSGSYNFTRSADEKNDENLLIIYDPQIAALFEQEFEAIYNQAQEK
jgi:phosphatidylserine/phosphatidylglycerophosphate/cardiolipin synthase-like enzyme